MHILNLFQISNIIQYDIDVHDPFSAALKTDVHMYKSVFWVYYRYNSYLPHHLKSKKIHITLWKSHFQSNKRILWGLTPPKVFMNTRQRNDEVLPESNKSIVHAPMKGFFNQMECTEEPTPPLCVHLSNPTPTVRIKVFNVISLCEPHNALKA